MAITSSAKKAIRSGKAKRVFNLRRQKAIKSAVSTYKELLAGKKTKEAAAALSNVYKAFDKAMKTDYLKKNTVARKKSRLAKMLKKAK